MRQAVVEQVGLAGKTLFLRRAGLRHDLARGGVVEQCRIQAADEFQHGGNARLQVGKSQFLVLQLGHVHAGQPCRDAFGKVAGDLGLAQQGKHVGKKARLQQGIGVDVFRGRMGFGLGQDAAEAAQHLFENGNRGSVDRAGHGFFQ